MAILNLSGIQPKKREKYLVYIGVLSFIVEIMYLSIIFYDTTLIGTLIIESYRLFEIFVQAFVKHIRKPR